MHALRYSFNNLPVMSTNALLLLNLQIDFLPGGATPAPGADQLVLLANSLMPEHSKCIATQVWHPANHLAFAAMHPWRRPGQIVQIQGVEQYLWPMHGVQNSFGAEFAPKLNTEAIDFVLQTGINPEVDQYSAFFDQAGNNSGLDAYLRKHSISQLSILGVPAEFHLLQTTLDALELGYETQVFLI